MTSTLKNIDWTAPATEIMDELVEAWYEKHGYDENDEKLEEAEAWAETQLARYAK